MTAEKILLVDDDSNILEGYRRGLIREFLLETALGGEQALTLAAENGPYAVVVSDMRMPGMDGIQLLSRIKALSPDTIRVMLTGNTDTETAINAINEGSIFRFLNKPCSKEVMAKTITAALMQYRLVTAEKHLLEQTLSGSLQVLTEVLSLINPAAFSRAERAAVHPSRRNQDEAGESVAIRGRGHVVATWLRDAASGNDRRCLPWGKVVGERAGAI